MVEQMDNLSDHPYDMLIEIANRVKLDNLSDLPYDMLIEIAKLLKKLEDFTFFRCVSKSLRAAVKDVYFEGLRVRQGTPYLMLAVRDGYDDIRELYSLVEGESIVASAKVPNFKSKKCLESLGWLLVSQAAGSMSLLEPFSGTEISLPHQSTFLGGSMDEFGFFEKMALSSRPSETSDFILMVIGSGIGNLGFWRLGDETWNMIEMRKGAYSDVVYHCDGRFYAISFPGYVYEFNLSGSDNQMVGRVVTTFMAKDVIPRVGGFRNVLVDNKRLYIVKTVDGSLLIITRTAPDLGEAYPPYTTTKFLVYEVDTVTDTFKEIYSLGSMAVFLGHSSTNAVDASRFPRGVIKPNHIYFTDDYWDYYHHVEGGGGMDSGVYNMETGTIEPIYPGEVLLSKVSPSTWITPCVT